MTAKDCHHMNPFLSYIVNVTIKSVSVTYNYMYMDFEIDFLAL